MNAVGNTLQTIGAVVNRIEHAHYCEQYLRGTNIRVGFFTADMLLAGLHCHSQCLFTSRVIRHTNNAAGSGALVSIAEGEETGMWSAEAHRYTKALAGADHNIGTH